MGAKIEAVKGKSPYAKKGKTPFKYGEQYERYTRAVGPTGIGRYSEEAEAADRSFRRYFHVPAYIDKTGPHYV